MVKVRQNQARIKELNKKELRELLTNAKKKADKMPKEKGSFRLEVVCTEEDIK